MFSTKKTFEEKIELRDNLAEIPHLMDRVSALRLQEDENLIKFGHLDRELWKQSYHNFYDKLDQIVKTLKLDQFEEKKLRMGTSSIKWYLIYKEYEYLEGKIFDLNEEGVLQSQYELLPYETKVRRILLKHRLNYYFQHNLNIMKKHPELAEFEKEFMNLMKKQNILYY